MINVRLAQAAVLGFAMALVIGILGWTGTIKIWGWGKAPTQEASATTSRMSDYERAGRVYPTK
jgi:hypothetical protein